MSYNVKTQAYSGPFDLLLQLVSRQKLDIGSISIAEVADQYMREVQSMGELDLDVASDFVLVASTLLDMKAAALVPNEPQRPRKEEEEEDDEDDLANLSPDEAREVLIARLIAYKQFRNAAAALGSRMEAESLMEPRTAGPDPEFMGLMPDYLEGITLRSLAVICADLDSRRQGFLLEAEHIAPKRLPIALTVASVDRVTRAHPLVSFSDLLDGDLRPETLVATFLAILELEKRGSVVLTQEHTFGEIDVARVEGAKPFELDNSDLTSIEEDA
ncbi:segregation/condensation protein A [Olsenella umbonata]|uniref:Segregation and condensation protein A n=1 Tax=Parafannyhessea umbonata TaxID=604330 RepID=A0A7X9Y0K5_9ACTN|nr:segregation/condensation protein A [Parafannyhessea umbonata]NMF26067.1 segregation/condensation protein A [Parafannyhessea umbonata]